MSALLDDNNIILTDSQLEALHLLKEMMENGKLCVWIVSTKLIIKFNSIPLDYPSINFQQDIDFLTKYLYANDWNARDAIKKIVQLYRIKVRKRKS